MKGEGAAELKVLKNYTFMRGELYCRMPGGVLSRCVGQDEAQRKLKEVHDKTCGSCGEVSLYCRLQRAGFYWPSMGKDADRVQTQYGTCQLAVNREESYDVFISEDWRIPFVQYLAEGFLPQKHGERYMLRRLAMHYFLPQKDGERYMLRRLAMHYFLHNTVLFKKGYDGDPLRCLGPEEAREMIKEVHSGECGEHKGKKKLYRCLLQMGYYWLTMKKDIAEFVKKCHSCQVQANLIHTHPHNLHSMVTPWPFHTWGLDLVGPVNLPSHGYIWILVVTEFTK